MQINLEATDKHTIQAYSDTEIKINSTGYHNGFIVSTHEIIENWAVNSIGAIDDEALSLLIKHNPEIILIGHNQTGHLAPMIIVHKLANQRIALESMNIGAACRTFNVLLSENRAVVLGIIF